MSKPVSNYNENFHKLFNDNAATAVDPSLYYPYGKNHRVSNKLLKMLSKAPPVPNKNYLQLLSKAPSVEPLINRHKASKNLNKMLNNAPHVPKKSPFLPKQNNLPNALRAASTAIRKNNPYGFSNARLKALRAQTHKNSNKSNKSKK